MYFDPSHSQVVEFERFVVDIAIDEEVVGLTGYDIVVDFDESLLEVVDVEEGDLPAGYAGETFLYWSTQGMQSERLVIDGALLGGSADGPGSLVSIEFEALAPGVSPLTFESVQLRDIENVPIPVVEEDGDVEIEQGGRVYIDPDFVSVEEDSVFCLVEVAIDSMVRDLTGFHLLIDFDESVLDPTGVERAGLMTAYGDTGETALYWSDEGQPSDALFIDGAFLGGSVDGPGALVGLCFHAMSPGLTPLDFIEVEFRDLENNEIPVGSVPGIVEVTTQGSSVERETWGAIKDRFR
ncbi:MAG: hypothetical protein GF400_06730 [Candidatus Eisenbacteria bacterium]|nr:hypothetical protein [Candidatus Eisenbacteria bacterium]